MSLLLPNFSSCPFSRTARGSSPPHAAPCLINTSRRRPGGRRRLRNPWGSLDLGVMQLLGASRCALKVEPRWKPSGETEGVPALQSACGKRRFLCDCHSATVHTCGACWCAISSLFRDDCRTEWVRLAAGLRQSAPCSEGAVGTVRTQLGDVALG